METNNFTLTIDAHIVLRLTKKNMRKIIANDSLYVAVENMLAEIESKKVYGMVSNVTGWHIQIRLGH